MVVLVGMAGAVWLQVNWLDVALAIPMALLLIRVCSQVLRGTLPWLVDHMAIAPEAIYAEAMATAGVMNCHDIASRGVLGQQVFIEMHMVVSADDLSTAHRITEQVEERLEESFGPCGAPSISNPRSTWRRSPTPVPMAEANTESLELAGLTGERQQRGLLRCWTKSAACWSWQLPVLLQERCWLRLSRTSPSCIACSPDGVMKHPN